MAVAPRIRNGGVYVPDHGSIGRWLLTSPELRKVLVLVSNQVSALAAVNTRASSTGGQRSEKEQLSGIRLANNYRVKKGPIVTVGASFPNPRMSQVVYNNKRYAAAREFGTGGHTLGGGTRDLRRAGAVFGDLAGSPE